MIKKSVFEEDIVNGMHQELIKHATSRSFDNLPKAVDYLNSAYEIFENAGLSKQADQILNIIAKIAGKTDVISMPSHKAMIEAGMKPNDPKEISSNPLAKARINNALRKLKMSDHDIIKFLGHKNFMPKEDSDELLDETRAFGKIHEWLRDPKIVSPKDELKPGDEFTIKSIADAYAKKKANDAHTKNLNSKKMIDNLKDHGTVFNMADDQFANDFLDKDIDQPLEIVDDSKDATFEDE